MAKTEAERKDFLASIGLNPESPMLEAKEPKVGGPESLVQTVVDFHTMPVSDIVFDPALLDEFTDLGGQNFKAAGDKVFAMYKSKTRDKDRNGLLHRKITEFIQQVKRDRKKKEA